MDKAKITKLEAMVIGIVTGFIVALVFLVKSYVYTPEPPKDQCWYEIKYLHVSGREITKRVYMTCEGFQHWHMSERYKVPAMVLPFSDGNEVLIQGATDIMSVEKIKEDDQRWLDTLQELPENE